MPLTIAVLSPIVSKISVDSLVINTVLAPPFHSTSAPKFSAINLIGQRVLESSFIKGFASGKFTTSPSILTTMSMS